MKTLKSFKFKGKRVLVRVDFNVPLNKQGEILDDFRIKAALPTIKYLLEKDAKIILMGHLGRPGGKKVESLKIDPIQDRLMELLDVSIVKAPGCVGKDIEDWTHKMQEQEILFLENLRFCKQEKDNDAEFAKALSMLGDIYINNAFSVCHRAHASVSGVPQYLPSGAGFLLEKEIKTISKITDNPSRPMVVIMGGSKVKTKIKLLNKMMQCCDYLLLGGVLANTVLKAKDIFIGSSVIDAEFRLDKKLSVNSEKLILPVDFITAKNNKTAIFKIRDIHSVKKDESIFDIGPETVKIFKNHIKKAKTIFWNGPVGLIENTKFAGGSESIAREIAENEGFSMVGGGETIELLSGLGLKGDISHISTGGGALLAFLSGEKLPGIEALKKH